MSWDNRILNINGYGKKMLKDAIKIACSKGNKFETKIEASIFDLNSGLILLWTPCEAATKFEKPLSSNEMTEIAFKWLSSEEAMKMKFEGWDSDADHDGSNSIGWRVYCEDWGHVAESNLCHKTSLFMAWQINRFKKPFSKSRICGVSSKSNLEGNR